MKRLVLTLLCAASLFAQQTPPPPAAPREAKLPQPVEKTLANGLRVIVVPKHDLPLVAASVMVKTGGAADPRGREGVASMTATVLTKGTKTKSAEQIARGVEALGATLSSEADWDAMNIDVSTMSSNLPKAMEYVADVVRNPTFAKEELDRERAQAIDALQANLAQPRTLAGVVASRLIFGDAPYGANLEGTPASLAKITRDDLVKFHRAYFRPDNAVLVLAGDVKEEDVFSLAQNLFGGWKSTATASSSTKTAAPALPKPRVVVVDMPDAGQAAVVVGRPGIRRVDPAFYRAIVMNSVLGAGYSSRLNQEVRIKRGLSYGAGSSFTARADVGPFTARTETKNESAAEVVGIVVGELSQLSAADAPESELTPRKAALIGGFAQSLETTSGIVGRISTLALYGLPLSDINRYISSVQAVTAEDVRKFAASNLGRDVSVVVVGDASKFLEPLKKQYPDVEVIKSSELDLGSATLRVRKAKQ
ncbi:MAG TPA: pitrilysin family protein [Thermoanaerobaculia bacterium]|nr:pitrilysin family protein [Thermoanaerobaculia bacterium]